MWDVVKKFIIKLGDETVKESSMPRSARLDTLSVMHRLMIRGIECRKIFWRKIDGTENLALSRLARRLLTKHPFLSPPLWLDE